MFCLIAMSNCFVFSLGMTRNIVELSLCTQNSSASGSSANVLGFDEGYGMNFTHVVSRMIEEMGYRVECELLEGKNYLICSIISSEGREIISSDVAIGMDDPRRYLPKVLVKKLDQAFPN